MTDRRIGVAIPTYKRPELLAELLDTIPDDVSVVVSDNGATLSDDYKAAWPRVDFLAAPELLPIFANWNNAARNQKSEWLVVPSDDDKYLPNSFAIARSWIGRHPEADMIIFGHHTIDGAGAVTGSWRPAPGLHRAPTGFHALRHGVDARMPSVFVRKALFDKVGGFGEHFKLTAGDSDFVQRAALLGTTLYVPEILSCYRIWGGGLTANRIATSEWMTEIDAWCDGVRRLDDASGTRAYSPRYHDEIYLRNLLAGVHALRRSAGRAACARYLRQQRFPLRAQSLTYVRLLHALL